MRRPVAIATGLVLLAAALVGVRVLGYGAYVVTSGSMEPAIPMGALVVDQAAPAQSIQPGEVITYTLPDRVVTHRVDSVAERDGRTVFVTRGDANSVADPWLAEPDGDVGAVRMTVPFLGFFVAAAQSWWRPLALALVMWLFLDAAATRMRRHLARTALLHGARS
jgi:signal peptidase I